jgi:hypothetical protein
MKKIIRLTESELTNLVKRIIKEQDEDDYLPIKELVIGSSFADSHVVLNNGEEYPVKFSMSKCPTGTYTQEQIPINCNAQTKINGETRFCGSDGCGHIPSQTTPDVFVTRMGNKGKNFVFQLKQPSEGVDMITYDVKTGEIRSNGEPGRIFARTQPNKDEEWVRDWLKRNHVKVFK